VIRGAATPRLDQLADEGIRFTNFNTELECTPSRSSLMTGRMPFRSGTGRAGFAGLPGGLANWEYTLAEMLADAGYQSAIYGKWHLGDIPGRFPTDQGFDEWWGFPFSTGVVYRYDQAGYDPEDPSLPYIVKSRKHGTVERVAPYNREMRAEIDSLIAVRSVAYIAEAVKSDKPFFLYIPWSHIHHPYVPHPDYKGATGAGDIADMIAEHDDNVGKVLDAVKAAGVENNTLVIYASDNGPDAAEYPKVSNSGPFRGYLGSAYEGSVRTPMMIRWTGTVPPGIETNQLVSINDFFPTLVTIAGGKAPDDRDYDGLDMTDFFLGKTDESPRKHAIFFLDQKLLAVKGERYKMYFIGDDPGASHRVHDDLWGFKIFNIQDDLREEHDVLVRNLWRIPPMIEPVLRFAGSIYKNGTIKVGDEVRTKAWFAIPPRYNSEEDMKKVLMLARDMQELRKRYAEEQAIRQEK
jgi:arylsulfatase